MQCSAVILSAKIKSLIQTKKAQTPSPPHPIPKKSALSKSTRMPQKQRGICSLPATLSHALFSLLLLLNVDDLVSRQDIYWKHNKLNNWKWKGDKSLSGGCRKKRELNGYSKKVSSGFTQTCQMQTLQGYALQRACVSVDKKPKKLPCSQYTVLILTVPKLRFCSAINSSTWQLSVATLEQMDRSTLTSVFSLSRRDTRAWTAPSLTLQIHKQYI